MTSDPSTFPDEPAQRQDNPTATGTPPQARQTPFVGLSGARLAATSLTLRASLAAWTRASQGVDPTVALTADWSQRVSFATRLVCTILGVDPACVTAIPDEDRYAWFGWHEVRLIVSDTLQIVSDTLRDAESAEEHPQQRDFEFICETADQQTGAVFLLRPCPECQQPVPTYAIQTLADLGDVILADRADPVHRLRPDAPAYATDPAHRTTCPMYVQRTA